MFECTRAVLCAALIATGLTLASGRQATAGQIEFNACVRERCSQPNASATSCASGCERHLGPGNAQDNRSRRSYGAIAVAHTTLQFGYAYDHGSRAAAEQAALKSCAKQGAGARECKVAIWFFNQCAALASSAEVPASENAWGAYYGDSRRVADGQALALCRKEGGTRCRVVASYCSTG